MLNWPVVGSHFPVLGIIGLAFITFQIVSGRAYFGFPGEPPILRRDRSVQYWMIVTGYTLLVIGVFYLELFDNQ